MIPTPSAEEGPDGCGPDHWERLYLEGRTPWDAGGSPASLERYLVNRKPTGRALVPGCGSGYEAARLAVAGSEVLAVDFSPAAIRRARMLSGRDGVSFREADFFALPDRDFDCIYERAFLCALPPSLRPRWATACARYLRPGGVLIGLFFVDPEATEGPPFGIGAAELDALLEPRFAKQEDRVSEGSLPVFEGRERWQVWERR